MDRLGWFVGLLAIAFFAAGCGVLTVPSAIPDSPHSDSSESSAAVQVPAGARQLIIEVSNTGGRNAALLVGKDVNFPHNDKVGNALPALVPPRASVRVVFTVPLTGGWAIFVNPGPGWGPILTASDLDDCVGLVPIVISVAGDGEPSWSSMARDMPACMNF